LIEKDFPRLLTAAEQLLATSESSASDLDDPCQTSSDHKIRPARVACPFQKLYPFYTLWGIAFSRVFDYYDSQEESLIGTTRGP